MKLKKIGVTGIAIALLVGGGATNDTYAMDQQEKIVTNVDYQVITPLWDNISGISPYISVEGTTLYPEVYVSAKSSSGTISETMYLEKYSFVRWKSVTSWGYSGTSSVFL